MIYKRVWRLAVSAVRREEKGREERRRGEERREEEQCGDDS